MDYQVRPLKTELIGKPQGGIDFSWLESSSMPLDVEIGCGVGWHAIQYAKENPNRRLIAIERTQEKFEKFQSRIRAHDTLANLLPVQADAIRWVIHGLKNESIQRFFILYPNLELKAPNKRWLRSSFMSQILRVLSPKGTITLATNERWYWEEAKAWGENAWNLRIQSAQPVSLNDRVPRTHFEKKYLQRGQTCFDLVLAKP